MADNHILQGPFDIPDIPDYIPRRLKPWLFILFVIIIQFSGGIYLAAASDMAASTALMQEDILMAGYAQLIGMSINFAVMFRLKFRFSARIGLLICGGVLIIANYICSHTTSVPLLVFVCFIAGWVRMWATFICNSTIQLWLTPVRDMAIFFCYVYLVVDGVIQLSGIATVYTAFFSTWEQMHLIMSGLLALMILLVLILVKSAKGPLQIPLLGIDWIGSGLWSVFMLCFAYICVYGNYHDWWDAPEIQYASVLGAVCLLLNLWRASFLHHPYISFQALANRNVWRATAVYLVFFTLMATEHVFEHSYASTILGFDETNLVDLNVYVFLGILAGVALTYFTFALRKWSYRTMTLIGFALATGYLSWFYFTIDYNIEKEALLLPLILRGAASVIISIVWLTSIVQSGLPFMVFPQALTINGFTGAVMGATLGPAIVGEIFRRVLMKNFGLLSSTLTDFNTSTHGIPLPQLMEHTMKQSMLVSMKEVYGMLLILAVCSIISILCIGRIVRPRAIFPTWRSIRKTIRRLALTPR